MRIAAKRAAVIVAFLFSLGIGIPGTMPESAGAASAGGTSPVGPAGGPAPPSGSPPICKNNYQKAQTTFTKYEQEALSAAKMVVMPALNELLSCLNDFEGVGFNKGYTTLMQVAQAILDNLASAVCNEMITAWDNAISTLPGPQSYSWDGYPIYESGGFGATGPVPGGSPFYSSGSGNLFGGGGTFEFGIPQSMNPIPGIENGIQNFGGPMDPNVGTWSYDSASQGSSSGSVSGPTVNPFGQ